MAAVPPGRHHPDKGGDAGKFREIQESYSVLVKAAYDAQHAARGRTSRDQAARGPFEQAAYGAQHTAWETLLREARSEQAVRATWYVPFREQAVRATSYVPATPEQAAQRRQRWEEEQRREEALNRKQTEDAQRREQARKREQAQDAARHASTAFEFSFGSWLMPLTCDRR